MRIIVAGSATSIHVDRWVRYLAGRGHEVTIFTPAASSDLPGSVSMQQIAGAGVPKVGRFILGSLQLSRHIRRVNPDVVHFHSVGAISLLAPAVPPHMLVISPWGSEIAAAARNPIRRVIVSFALRRAALVLTTSRSMASDAASKFGVAPERLAVISWGVDTSLFQPIGQAERRRRRVALGLPQDELIMTAIRTTSRTYRTRELLRAFARARPDGMHLVVNAGFAVGDRRGAAVQARYRSEIRGLARDLGANRCTLIERRLSRAEYAALLSCSDVAVSIPLSDQRSSSVLEALAVGATVVGSAIDPYRELQADGFAIQLLAEPIEPTLAGWLRSGKQIGDAERAANIDLIAATEVSDERYRAMEEMLQRIATPGGFEPGPGPAGWTGDPR
jgi:glycosyltransferase involved in cell wall biosynthesis